VSLVDQQPVKDQPVRSTGHSIGQVLDEAIGLIEAFPEDGTSERVNHLGV